MSVDLSTLSSDLLVQCGGLISNNVTKTDNVADKTFEGFLHKHLNKDAKVWIYERECPFMSKERLDTYFGNIAFIQHSQSCDRNMFNVRLVSGCQEYDIKQWIYYYEGFLGNPIASSNHIIRLGLLKYFFAESFDPFQETMKRILEMPPTKEWMKIALSKKTSPIEERQPDLVFSFAQGQLLAIL